MTTLYITTERTRGISNRVLLVIELKSAPYVKSRNKVGGWFFKLFVTLEQLPLRSTLTPTWSDLAKALLFYLIPTSAFAMQNPLPVDAIIPELGVSLQDLETYVAHVREGQYVSGVNFILIPMHLSRYCQLLMAGITLIVYDYFCTLEEEVSFVWGQAPRLVAAKILFALVRPPHPILPPARLPHRIESIPAHIHINLPIHRVQ